MNESSEIDIKIFSDQDNLNPTEKESNNYSKSNILSNTSNGMYIYSSPFNCFAFSMIFSLFSIGIGLFIVFIILGIHNDLVFWLFMLFLPIFLIVLSIIFSCAISLRDKIVIDFEKGLIYTKTQKFLFCFGQKNTFSLIEIEQVIIQVNPNLHYTEDEIAYDCFDVIFRLLNGKEIKGASGVINKNNECRKAIDFMKKGIPHNIPINGDLVENSQIALGNDSKQLNDIQ